MVTQREEGSFALYDDHVAALDTALEVLEVCRLASIVVQCHSPDGRAVSGASNWSVCNSRKLAACCGMGPHMALTPSGARACGAKNASHRYTLFLG